MPRPLQLLLFEAGGERPSLAAPLAALGLAVRTVREAWALARPHAELLDGVDLLLLEADAAGGEGLALLRALRRHSMLPAMVLLQRDDAFERVLAYESGADDCLAWPLATRELQARIAALLRRAGAAPAHAPNPALTLGDWQLDLAGRRVRRGDGPAVALGEVECRLMRVFLERPGQVLGRQDLLRAAGDADDAAASRRVDLAVCRLRHKLGDDGRGPRWIRTLRGRGYRFDPSTCE